MKIYRSKRSHGLDSLMSSNGRLKFSSHSCYCLQRTRSSCPSADEGRLLAYDTKDMIILEKNLQFLL